MRNLDVRSSNGPAREDREGYVAAAQGRGKPDSLRNYLQKKTHQAIHDAREKVAREKVDVGEQIVGHNQVIATKQARQAAIPADKTRVDGAKAQAQNELIQYRHQTRDIKKPSGLKYWILGLFWVVVLSMAACLFIFYQNTVYKGFFFELPPDVDEASAQAAFQVFSAGSFDEAKQDGPTTLLLTLLAPTIFIGLGLLGHLLIQTDKIKRERKKLFIGLLMAGTFAFDFLLAYKIAKIPYQVRGATSILGPIGEGDFWLVIFFGFVTYIIWGFLFHFTWDESEKIGEQKEEYKEKEQRIRAYNAKINGHEATLAALAREDGELPGQIRQLEQRIEALEQRIAALEAQLTNGHIITKDAIVPLLAEFTEDWVAYIYDETGRPDGDPDVTRDDVPKCHEVYDNFINNLTI